ncbi:MAG: LytR/AlgR family response regulator transcription factor [Bacillus sp. (in: firmicutes)]
MLKVYIVDDEMFARDELKYLLNRSRQVEVIGENDCIEDALGEIASTKPDLVFLDIELADESGLQLARDLEQLESPPAVVFATAYDEYALSAFDFNAVDYILKPFDEDRILKTLDKIKSIQKIGKTKRQEPVFQQGDIHKKLAICVDERIILLPYEDICYVESHEGKTVIKTNQSLHKVNETLAYWEKRLPGGPFARVHRSFIVNMEQIAEIEPWFNSTYNLILQDGSKVPVSRTYGKKLKQLVGF